MNLQNVRQLENTRKKLRKLEERYELTRADSGAPEHVRELTMRSLKRLINQFKEEIVRFEARSTAPARHD
jgi:hypothetical protein